MSQQKLNIGVVAPPFIPIPPPGYGGTELVIYNLVEGLKRLGHKVFLFAPLESGTSADEFFPYVEDKNVSLTLASAIEVKTIACELGTKYAYGMAGYRGADIIHDHTLSNNITSIPSIHTLHGPGTEGAVKKCAEISRNPLNHFITISGRQQEIYRTLSRDINFAGTVYNSIDVNRTSWSETKEDFLLFVGRINWEKGPDMAIRVAAKLKDPLVMVVKMSEQFEKDFFSRDIQPLMERFPKKIEVKLYEEPPQDFKFKLYQKAKCTLFTSQWEEPFGLVMIESMASGTPVVALRRGAAPEVIKDGVSGFVVDNEDEYVEAVRESSKLSPRECRAHVEKFFSVEKMAADYVSQYRKIIGGKI